MPIRYYPAILERTGDGFGISFPDFPGCISSGSDWQEAAANAEEALALHIAGTLEDRLPLPDPTPLDQVECDPDTDEAARLLVRAILPG